MGLLAVSLTGATAWIVLASGQLDIRQVEVKGISRLGTAQVRAAAAVPIGSPMVRFDPAAARRRVAGLPAVSRVRVERAWPTTVRVVVTERAAVAAVPLPDGVALADRTGMLFATAPVPPQELPLLMVPMPAPGDPTTRSALAVLTGLPAPLHDRVRTVAATSPSSVQLTLRDGRQVIWGDSADGPHKAAVLAQLLLRPALVYDVSAPDVAATR